MSKNVKMSDCQKAYTTVKVTGVFVGMLCRLFRSIVFNLMMLLLGICVGYSYMACRMHYYANKCDNVEYINAIKQKVKELADMDALYANKQEEIYDVLKQLKMKLVEDSNSVSNAPLGKLLMH